MSNKAYRSIFSGHEIDEAIANMRGALSAALIVNDFSGGTAKIASAELAKILNQKIIDNTTAQVIKDRLLSLPNTNTVNDEQLANIKKMNTKFVGSFTDDDNRQSSIDVVPYTGAEISFLVDDGSGDGLQELSYWNKNTNSWNKARLYNLGEYTPTKFPTASDNIIFSFRKDRYNTMKCIISVCNETNTQRQVQEVLITYIGADTYISVYGEVGNKTDLFDVTSSITGNSVNLIVNTKDDNLIVSGKQTVMI